MIGTRQTARARPAAPEVAAPRGRVNRAVAAMPSFGIRRFFDLVATLEGVISLGVGEPDFVTPWHVREAAIWAVEHGFTTYTANAGLPALRQAIAADLLADYGVAFDPGGEVLVTVGVSEGMDLALRASLEPGDEALIPSCATSPTAPARCSPAACRCRCPPILAARLQGSAGGVGGAHHPAHARPRPSSKTEPNQAHALLARAARPAVG